MDEIVGKISGVNSEKHLDVSPNLLRKMYVTMVKIRKFEEKAGELVSQKEIICPCHLYIGQEAVATGVCAALKNDDYIFGTHRSHGHYIAKGGDIKLLMAELYGKATGCSRGKGGSMHTAYPSVGILGTSAIVAGTIPIAVGAALASVMKGSDQVSVAFFGDGAADEGVFYESLNFAALKKVPVIFVCENNLYSAHMHISARQSETDIYKKARVFKVPAVQIDGNDVIEVFQVAKEVVERTRKRSDPALIECLTYRWRGHVGPSWDLDKGIRSKEEVEYWVSKCPINRLEDFMRKQGSLSESEIIEIHKSIEKEIERAILFARESPYPDESKLCSDVLRLKEEA